MVNVVAEPTPNPATMKFLPGCPVMASGTVDFPDADAADISPLANRLFSIGGVRGVFLGGDFVSVAKDETADWTALEPEVGAAIASHFEAGRPVLDGAVGADAAAPGTVAEENSKVVARIRELLDTHVRPSVAMDGGDIVYRGFARGVVYVSLRGACVGCPRSAATLKIGVENLLKHYLPDVVRVDALP